MPENIEFLDLIGNTVLFSGTAKVELLKNGGKQYTFSNNEKTFICRIFDKGCRIVSQSDMNVDISLMPRKTGKVSIHSEHGNLDLSCQCELYERSAAGAQIRYTFEGQPFHFVLRQKEEE